MHGAAEQGHNGAVKTVRSTVKVAGCKKAKKAAPKKPASAKKETATRR